MLGWRAAARIVPTPRQLKEGRAASQDLDAMRRGIGAEEGICAPLGIAKILAIGIDHLHSRISAQVAG